MRSGTVPLMTHRNFGRKFDSRVSICIPFYKELPLLRIQRRYSKKFGVKLQFLFDEKLLRKRRYFWVKMIGETFRNSGNSIEQGYADFAKKARRDWVLRIDSDEILNLKGLQFLDQFDLEENHVVGFLRYQVVLLEDNFYVLANSEFNPNQHVQWRLFNRNFGSFGSDEIHNPGFKLIDRYSFLSPPDCAIYHLDFAVRDHESRVSKSLRYSKLGQDNDMQRFQILPEKDWQLMPVPDFEILDFLNENIQLLKKSRSSSLNWEKE